MKRCDVVDSEAVRMNEENKRIRRHAIRYLKMADEIAKEKFANAYDWSYETQMQAIKNVLLAIRMVK